MEAAAGRECRVREISLLAPACRPDSSSLTVPRLGLSRNVDAQRDDKCGMLPGLSRQRPSIAGTQDVWLYACINCADPCGNVIEVGLVLRPPVHDDEGSHVGWLRHSFEELMGLVFPSLLTRSLCGSHSEYPTSLHHSLRGSSMCLDERDSQVTSRYQAA